MTKPSVEEQLAALRRKGTLLQRNMHRTSNRAVADTVMVAASAECHLALLDSHFRQLCQVQQQIEEIDLEENSRDQFEAEFIATKSTLLKRANVNKRKGPEDSVLINSTCLGASSQFRFKTCL